MEEREWKERKRRREGWRRENERSVRGRRETYFIDEFDTFTFAVIASKELAVRYVACIVTSSDLIRAVTAVYIL